MGLIVEPLRLGLIIKRAHCGFELRVEWNSGSFLGLIEAIGSQFIGNEAAHFLGVLLAALHLFISAFDPLFFFYVLLQLVVLIRYHLPR